MRFIATVGVNKVKQSFYIQTKLPPPETQPTRRAHALGAAPWPCSRASVAVPQKGRMATGDLGWCGLRRVFVVYHKAGTIFMERSSELLHRELQRLCRHHAMAKPIEVLRRTGVP